jgi:uncharacterized protein (UPF0297 family)
MSKAIRDLSIKIKDKVKEANMDIYKAIEKKTYNPRLAEKYYESSKDNISEIMGLHDSVVEEIERERKKNGEPPKVMLEIWDCDHKSIIADVEEIKILQEYYESL